MYLRNHRCAHTHTQSAAVTNDEGEPSEEDDHGYTAELRELAAIDDFNADEMPSPEALELIDQYMTSAEDYLAAVSVSFAAL